MPLVMPKYLKILRSNNLKIFSHYFFIGSQSSLMAEMPPGATSRLARGS